MKFPVGGSTGPAWLAAAALAVACGGCGDKSAQVPPVSVPATEAMAVSTEPAGTPAAEHSRSASSAAAEEAAVPGGTDAPTAYVLARTDNLPDPLELTSEDWPQFRGALRDGISRAAGLADAWPEGGPSECWRIQLGQGYSSPAVVRDHVFLNDYDEGRNVWMVRCHHLESGEELWRYEVAKRIRPNHAITRSVPATDGGFVISLDPKCELHCLDARDGTLIWKMFLPTAYDSQIPPWYNGQCPLLDGDRLVIASGGRTLLVALDKRTGKAIWETPNVSGHLMSHASIMPLEIEGVRQYAYLTLKGAVGVAAEDGRLLWDFPWQFNTAVPTTPLPLGDGKLLLTSGYHAQTVICQVRREGETWIADEFLGFPPPTQGWNSEVHTPIVHRGFVYGVGKKKRGLWTCLNFDGQELWTSGDKASFGLGGYLLADDKFYVLEGGTGTVRMLDANADEYRELAAAELLEGPDVWAPPVISRGKLLIRDLHELVCLDIGEEDTAKSPTASVGADISR